MPQPAKHLRPSLISIGAFTLCASLAFARQSVSATAAHSSGMSGMALHMRFTALRPLQPGDKQRATAIVADAKEAMAPYQDYRKALADGYHIFLPNVPQQIYHFTNSANAIEAQIHFDPLKPTSLLYRKISDGGYKLIGVMYTDRVTASEDELNSRVPLSIARWHQHVNFCRAPIGHIRESFGPHPKFGALGSINTRAACEAAGGTFYPHIFGWMVHVYPYETDPKKIWSVNDDQDHDTMDRSTMPAMKPPIKMDQ
ncbi:MAG TPA: hypothetical protein VME86_04100 [Acidobacteriaceae bacterium]|nr:hypothetical protein [Acidobacteriaceae bacterium]